MTSGGGTYDGAFPDFSRSASSPLKPQAVSVGSYSSMRNNQLCTCIVARATDKALIVKALEEVATVMRAHGAEPATTLP